MVKKNGPSMRQSRFDSVVVHALLKKLYAWILLKCLYQCMLHWKPRKLYHARMTDVHELLVGPLCCK